MQILRRAVSVLIFIAQWSSLQSYCYLEIELQAGHPYTLIGHSSTFLRSTGVSDRGFSDCGDKQGPSESGGQIVFFRFL